MNNTELSDLERHLALKISVVIGDVVQLIDDPGARATVVAMATSITFRAAAEVIRDTYEEDTGKKASVESIILMLAKECVRFAKSKPLSSQRKKAK